MSSRDRYQSNLDAFTSRQAGAFLFDTGEQPDSKSPKKLEKYILENSQGLEMRTIIKGSATMAALTYYGILREGFKSEAAQKVSDVIKRLAISDNGTGREQAQAVLQGNLPKEIEVKTGQA